MQQDLAELTIAAVDSLFGQLTSRVYASLAYTGRRTLSEIVRQTKLNSRQVGSTLAVLVQNHLVYHFNEILGGPVYYHANWETAYNLAFRYGKLSKYVEHRLGPAAAEVVQTVASLGHTTPSNLEKSLGLDKKNVRRDTPTTNGQEQTDVLLESSKSQVKSIKHLHILLQDLLECGLLRLTTEFQFMPEHDLHSTAERHVNDEAFQGAGPKTTSDKALFEAKVRSKKRSWRDAADELSAASGKPTKRLKIGNRMNGMNGRANDDEDGDLPAHLRLSDDNIVQLNFDKCNVLIRNAQLVNLAHRYIGETTSRVYAALLRSLEAQQLRCWDPHDLLVDLEEENEHDLIVKNLPGPGTILEHVEPGTNLAFGLPATNDKKGVNGNHKGNPVDVSDNSDSDSDPDTPVVKSKKKAQETRDANTLATLQVEAHLRLLECDPRQFVQSAGRGWTVPFKRLTRYLIQNSIENTITARFGSLAARIVRVLQANYSMDEKGLSSAAILKPKEVRLLTNTLLSAGLIETQEIPRDTNRTTNRLMWLYSYSPERARKQLMIDSYRAMTRLLVRLDVEKNEYRGTLEKAERSDVVGKEEELLSFSDRTQLSQWRAKEKLFLGHVERVDELVACMRDFAPIEDPWVGNRKRPEGDEDRDGE